MAWFRLVWVVLGRCGWFRLVVDGFGWFLGRCGCSRLVVMVLAGVVVGGCGPFGLFFGGCGSFWLVPRFSMYADSKLVSSTLPEDTMLIIILISWQKDVVRNSPQ